MNMQNLESGRNLWDCKIELYCSSTLINQFFSTKNSFLQLPSGKTTLKCVVLFTSVFFTNFFHKVVRRNVKLPQEIVNLDSKIKHLSAVYKKDIEKMCIQQQSLSPP